MNPIQKILVIVDPTQDEQPAVAKAALLAKTFNAELELFACDTKASLAARHATHMRGSPQEPFVASLQPWLERLAQRIRADGVNVTATTRQVERPLHTELLKRITDSGAQLVVKDTHHHSVARRTFLSNTDWHLIRGCWSPLLLVTQRVWNSHPCIVAAVDPEHTNDKPATLDGRILNYANLITKRLSGQLHVAHAYLPSVTPLAIASETPLISMATPEELRLQEQRIRAAIARLTAQTQVQAAQVHVQMGSPVEVLTQLAARLPADITVMGAISRSGFEGIFIGSTAEHILETLSSDSLIVKTPDFAGSLPF